MYFSLGVHVARPSPYFWPPAMPNSVAIFQLFTIFKACLCVQITTHSLFAVNTVELCRCLLCSGDESWIALQ